MSTNEITTKVRRMKRLQAKAEQLQAEITAIQDEIKAVMTAQGAEEMTAGEFKIRYSVITSNRFDSKADFEQSFSRFKDYAASRDFSSVEQALTGEIVTELCEDIFNKSVVNW